MMGGMQPPGQAWGQVPMGQPPPMVGYSGGYNNGLADFTAQPLQGTVMGGAQMPGLGLGLQPNTAVTVQGVVEDDAQARLGEGGVSARGSGE